MALYNFFHYIQYVQILKAYNEIINYQLVILASQK